MSRRHRLLLPGLIAAAIGLAVLPAMAQKAPAKPAAKPAAAASADNGKAIYDAHCAMCHGTGAAGAPKLGDKAAWAPRIKLGEPALLQAAIKGIRAMPPRGACAKCSDADLKAAVGYMVAQSK